VTTHLRVRAGGHELLLPSTSVLHITDNGGDEAVPLLDLPRTLGAAAPGSVVILYGEEEDAIRLRVDEVIGLVNVPEGMLARLPVLTSRFAQLFDSITVEAIEGRHPLCLRARLAVES